MRRMMKRLLPALLALVLFPAAVTAEDALPPVPHELRLVYAAPASQIIADENGTETVVDTVIYIYSDGVYKQYVIIDGKTETFSEGTYEIHANGKLENPLVLSIQTQKYRQPDGALADDERSFEVNMEDVNDYCLYPKDLREDLKLVAVFMHGEKQKLVHTDNTEEFLPTIWLYYEDGTFQQYVSMADAEDVLFSTGDYTISGDFLTDKSVLTIHRTQKYQDGAGLTDYDSTHDYEIGSLGFIRIWPEE